MCIITKDVDVNGCRCAADIGRMLDVARMPATSTAELREIWNVSELNNGKLDKRRYDDITDLKLAKIKENFVFKSLSLF